MKSKTIIRQDKLTIAQKLRSFTFSEPSQKTSAEPSSSSPSPSKSFNNKEDIDVPGQGSNNLNPKTKLEQLIENIDELKGHIEYQEDVYRQLSVDKRGQNELIEELHLDIEKLKEAKNLKKKLTLLLDNPEESKLKLEQTLEAAKRRKETLKAKFESHRAPLVTQLESFIGENSVKLQRAEDKINRIRNIRSMIAEITNDDENKKFRIQQLQAELSQMKKMTDRFQFTSRIVDIVKSIKRQNNDIDEILKDTKVRGSVISKFKNSFNFPIVCSKSQ